MRRVPLLLSALGCFLVGPAAAYLLQTTGDQALQDIAGLFILVSPALAGLGVFLLRMIQRRDLRPFRKIALGLCSGLPAGLVWGLGLRVGMRLVALAAGREPKFTLGGTLLILLMGTLFGASFGVLFASVRHWLPGQRLRRGFAFGAILAVLFWYPFFRAAGEDLKEVVHPAIVVFASSTLSLLWVGYGFVLEAVAEKWEGRLFGSPAQPHREASTPWVF